MEKAKVHSISVSAMRFKNIALDFKVKDVMVYSICHMVCLLVCITYTYCCDAAILDRVVAFVDDRAITLSEFEETYKTMKEQSPSITAEEIINSMINRLLLLKEANKIRLEGPSDDELVKEYINIKIRSMILIKDNEIKAFYVSHADEFRGQEFDAVKDDIEKYLIEKETNEQLKKHLDELRLHAEIKIQLTNAP
ncbi:MAG: hypothetical protein ACLPX5_16990 [Dissulfurispiraceae bacterium]